MHAHSPFKRLDWLRECWREQKKNQRAAQKGKVSETKKPYTPKKSPVTEKPELPQKSAVTEKPELPQKSAVTEKPELLITCIQSIKR